MARILLTEDDDAVRGFVERALSLDGHQLENAENGEQAMTHMDFSKGNFDLLLSDIKMPIMDGILLAKTVASKWPSVKIMLMTGFAEYSERANGLHQIVYDVVDKPFTLIKLRQSVTNALNNVGINKSVELPKVLYKGKSFYY